MKTTSKKNEKNEDDLKKKMEKNEDDLKKNLFLIPLKFRGQPFLGLAQLSKIFDVFLVIYVGSNVEKLPDGR
jgi:hypothetical protein